MNFQRVRESRQRWQIICGQCSRWHPEGKVLANLSKVGDFWCENCAKGAVFFMNLETGSVDTRDGWPHENEDGETVDAVDRGEVVAVRWDGESWVEA